MSAHRPSLSYLTAQVVMCIAHQCCGVLLRRTLPTWQGNNVVSAQSRMVRGSKGW
jgi:hypothetical protein